MSQSQTIRKALASVLLMGGVAGSALAVGLPLQQRFEGYPDGTPLDTLAGEGWGGSSNLVAIRTITNGVDAILGTNALAVPPSLIASNIATSALATNVWIDFYAHPSMGMVPSQVGAEAIDSSQAVEMFLDTNGFPVVWDPVSAGWLVHSQDVWQAAVATFSTSAWVRLTLCENYSNKTAALFLGGHLMRSGLRFINTNLAGCARFQIESGSASTSLVDEVSMQYTPPADLAADLDQDGMADAQEIQLYGNVTTRHRLIITGATVGGGTLTLSATNIIPGTSVDCALTAQVAYAAASLTSNGVSVAAFAGQPRTASYTFPAPGSDMVVTGVFAYTGTRWVPADYATLALAMAAALPGDTIRISPGTYVTDLALGAGLNYSGTNVVLQGTLTLPSGTATLIGCSGLQVTGGTTVPSGSTLVVSGGTVDLGTLTLQAGGTLQIIGATSCTVNGTVLSGTTTLSAGWESTVVPQVLPFSDNFDAYAIGTPLAQLGYRGWSAPADVVVENTQVQGGNAVVVPASESLVGTLAGPHSSNVWVELYYQDGNRIALEAIVASAVDTNVAVEMFLSTNGYVVVFNPDLGQWDLCTNDVVGAPVAALAGSAWSRITVNENYVRGRAALFLNGRLLRDQLRFINTNLVNGGSVEVDSGTAGPTYVDTYSARTNWVGIASDDADRDAWPDAQEIDLYGDLSQAPVGCLYLFR